MANINDWKSCTDYDDDLSKIDHYKKHPEMMPYIGKHYNEARILLVGESHYCSDKINHVEKEYLNNNWYNQKTPNDFTDKKYFNTRYVVENFLKGNRSRSHSMFRNPAKGLIEALDLTNENITDSEIFSACAFMNYFQRPEVNQGKTMKCTSEDKENAKYVFKSAVAILKPKLIIFLTQKSYDCYCEDEPINDNDKIYAVSHPTCKHWYGENGLDKFINLVQKANIGDVFERYRMPELSKVKGEIEKRQYKIVYKRSHSESDIKVKLYAKGEELNEIVWYFKSNNSRFGVGYLVKYNVIWIWNYDTKEYVDEKNSDVSGAYYQIKQFIESL